MTMRAAAIDAYGPADGLRVQELPRPVPRDGEVLVRVAYAGVQLTDAVIRAGGFTPPGATIEFPLVVGNEFSGTVAEVGAGVTGLPPGQDVMGFRVLGCYAEYVAVPAENVVARPDGVAPDHAGALSASGQTAYTAVEALGIASGETVVVHGGAGGVGTVFTQLARLRGARVIATASPANHDYLAGLGATPVAYGDGQLERLRAAAPQGYAAAFDAAGHGDLHTDIELGVDRSRIATIADMELAGELGCLVVRSQRSGARLAELAGLVAAGKLVIHVRRTYSLDRAADAHRDVETGHGRGKVVLEVAAR